MYGGDNSVVTRCQLIKDQISEPVTFNVLCGLILSVQFFPPIFQNALCYPLFIALVSAFLCTIPSHLLYLCGKILPIH